MDIKNRSLSQTSQELDDIMDGDQLGLSLTLVSSNSSITTNKLVESTELEERKEKIKEDNAAITTQIQNKGNLQGGLTSHVTTASPPNRKARVSVRARCESATVSSTYTNINFRFFFLLL